MPKIWLAPTGSISRGHVLDCAVGPLEARLREYDPQLYVRWAPKKLRGWGCWELRRRPENKVPVESVPFEGNTITRLEYRETGDVSHLKDFSFLNYDIFRWLYDTDTWRDSWKAKNWAKELEYREAKAQEAIEEKALAEKEYMIKQHRSQVRDFMDFVRSGGNPYRIADHWK